MIAVPPRRRVLGVLAACLLLMPLGGQAQTPLVVSLAPAPEFVPVLVAADQGFFKNRDLGVAPQITPNGAVAIQGIQAGSIQIGSVSVSSLLQATDSGLDLVVVCGGAIASSSDKNYGIVAKTGSGIERAEDLVDKRIGVAGLDSFFHVLARQWLTNKGVDFKKVTFVEAPFPQLADVMKAGNVHAVITTEPFLGRTVGSGVGEKVFYIAADLPDGLPPFVYVARRDWVLKNADVVRRFREAMDEAVQFTAARPAEAVAVYGKHVKLPPEALASIRINKLDTRVTTQQLELWEGMMRRQGMLRKPLVAARLLAP